MKKITIIIPVFNWENTLIQLFNSLENQNNKEFIDKIIIINNNSKDNSLDLINKYKKESFYDIKIINNKINLGLAEAYNLWLDCVKSEYFLLIHQDITIISNNSFNNLINKISNIDFVCLFPIILHNKKFYERYSFWQKAMFSRFIWKEIKNLTWKYDIFNTKIFKEKIIKFDNISFYTAWEDSDFKIKSSINWLKIDCSYEKINHLHYLKKDFSLKNWLKKEALLSEVEWVLLRKYFKYKIYDIKNFFLVYFRSLLLIFVIFSIVINNPLIYSILIIILAYYSYSYTKILYFEKWNNFYKILLPIINILILFISFYNNLKWFINWKQSKFT